ncbi:MAG: hypothetical protein K2J78_11990, partial [Muribaculaceae bacterium]|nr:hypothetical protein [Muribaculaceae bacterium]
MGELRNTGLFVIVIGMAMSGCKKELDIEYKDIAPITVIEGEVNQNGARVRITMTTPMDEPMDTTALTDAVVTLTDLTAGSSEILDTDEYGNYRNSVAGIPGHRYQLNVERPAESYTSVCEYLNPTDILGLEFNWIKMPYDYVAVLQVTFTDNSENDGECYWVRLYRNGKAYMWNLVTDVYEAQGVINDVFMTSRKDLDEEDDATALRDGDVIRATVSPISRGMFDYLQAVSSDSNGPS